MFFLLLRSGLPRWAICALYALIITGFSDVTLDNAEAGAQANTGAGSTPEFVDPTSLRSALLQEGTVKDHNRELYCNLKAALVIDNSSGEPLYSQKAQEIRPVASISKLLTAITLLEMGFDPDTVIRISKADARRSSKSILYTGDRARAGDLLRAALIGSDNRAARALARTFGGSYEKFGKLMTETARRLGLRQTTMVEPTGLDSRNRSTALDCAVLVNLGLRYPEIVAASHQKKFKFKVTNRRGKARTRSCVTTNRLVYSKYRTLVGKTGYIQASDYCLATTLENKAGERLTVVVLGAPWSGTRFKEARRLADFGFRKLRKMRTKVQTASSSTTG